MDVETFVEQSLHELSSLSMFAPSTIAKEVSIVRKAAERYLQRAEIQLAACSIFALLTTRMGIADQPNANYCTMLCDSGCIPLPVASLKHSVRATDDELAITSK